MRRSSQVAPARSVERPIAHPNGVDASFSTCASETFETSDSLPLPHERPCVLVVDDQRYVIEILKNELAGQLEIDFHACLDSSAALEMARACKPTVILQDLVMPNADGFAMLRLYRVDPFLRDVPVIILSSREQPQDKSRAFAMGASDYLVKIPDPIELAARVRSHSMSYLARRERDVAFRQLASVKNQLELQNAELERLATRDGLTGLANRRHFDENLVTELRRAHRDRTELSLILADVDYFKRFNDRYGHVEGDECLRRVAGALRSCVRRAMDVSARYGGEEFAMLLPSTPREAACGLAEAMRRAVAELQIPHAASDVASHVTSSLGVSSQRPGVLLAPTDLIGQADRALYHAKGSGRNCYGVSSDPEDAEIAAGGGPAA